MLFAGNKRFPIPDSEDDVNNVAQVPKESLAETVTENQSIWQDCQEGFGTVLGMALSV